MPTTSACRHRCMAGITFTVAIFATPSTPQRTLLIGRIPESSIQELTHRARRPGGASHRQAKLPSRRSDGNQRKDFNIDPLAKRGMTWRLANLDAVGGQQ